MDQVEAIKANPEKSNRAIAAELGINPSTVNRARNSGEPCGSPERTGQDDQAAHQRL